MREVIVRESPSLRPFDSYSVTYPACHAAAINVSKNNLLNICLVQASIGGNMYIMDAFVQMQFITSLS